MCYSAKYDLSLWYSINLPFFKRWGFKRWGLNGGGLKGGGLKGGGLKGEEL
jgi:hypothetical protein